MREGVRRFRVRKESLRLLRTSKDNSRVKSDLFTDQEFVMHRFNLLQVINGSFVLLLLVLAGCRRPTPIKEIAGHSDQYKGKEVMIRGTVVSGFSAAPASKTSFYVLSDGTGQMYVTTVSSIPTINHQVTVTGTLLIKPALALPAMGQFRLSDEMVVEKERQESSG
jgi:hypothetical protein